MNLVKKYNIACPRYTSYPTVPFWNNNSFTHRNWEQSIQKIYSQSGDEGISLYIHLPFCESLCTYCGCNTRITVNHSVELQYINAVLKEWEMYLQILSSKPKIKEIHLGGGTPTFFSASNLEKLISGILKTTSAGSDFDFSFEGHPNNTTREHLQQLHALGFSRVSYGIQDFDPVVQRAINRIQSFETVEKIIRVSRDIGYKSVNFDLIYGLPFQTLKSIQETIEKVIKLDPDRIANYSYAHVPWLKRAQQKFTTDDLPSADQKLELYNTGRKLLEEAGYYEIGMDHFAKKTDALYQSYLSNRLHRNFMGYTTSNTRLLIGLGVSSISDAWFAFGQNLKIVEDYLKVIKENKLPVVKGHILTDEDLVLRKHILNLMCRYETSWDNDCEVDPALFLGIDRMEELVKDDLVRFEWNKIKVTNEGRRFVRNICMALDNRLHESKPKETVFSNAI